MIVYKIEPNGQATNFQPQSNDYKLADNERSIDSDIVPDSDEHYKYHEGTYILQSAKDKLIEYIDMGHTKQKAQGLPCSVHNDVQFDIDWLQKYLPLLDMQIANGALKVFPRTVSKKRVNISAAKYPDFKQAFFQYMSIGTGKEGSQDFKEGIETYHKKQIDTVLNAKSKRALNSIRTEVEGHYNEFHSGSVIK